MYMVAEGLREELKSQTCSIFLWPVPCILNKYCWKVTEFMNIAIK